MSVASNIPGRGTRYAVRLACVALLPLCGHADHLTAAELESDHGFSERRIALQATVLRWLATLDGAPVAR